MPPLIYIVASLTLGIMPEHNLQKANSGWMIELYIGIRHGRGGAAPGAGPPPPPPKSAKSQNLVKVQAARPVNISPNSRKLKKKSGLY